MPVVSRRDLAINLASLGEHEASARVQTISDADDQSICDIGFQHALSGMLAQFRASFSEGTCYMTLSYGREELEEHYNTTTKKWDHAIKL